MRLVCVVALWSCLGLASACSRSPEATILIAAPAHTVASRTARLSLSISIPGQLTAKSHGTVDFSAHRLSMVTKYSALRSDVNPSETTVEIRIIGLDLYARSAESRAPQGLWSHHTTGTTPGGTGFFLPGVGGVASNDPTAMLGVLRGVSGSIRTVDKPELNGVPTTHYRATVDLKKAEAKAPAGAQARFDEMAAAWGVSQIPVDVWIDDAQRLRRLSFSLELSRFRSASGRSLGCSGTGSIEFELNDFGTPVTIEAPPPNQVSK